jgi:hypothetical protein
MLMTLVLPGSAQIAAGNRRVGRIAMRIWGGLVLTAALLALVSWAFPKVAFFLFAKTVVLSFVRFLLIALAIGFGYLLVDSWRLGDPLELRQKQRLFMTGLTTGVSLTVVGALLFASRGPRGLHFSHVRQCRCEQKPTTVVTTYTSWWRQRRNRWGLRPTRSRWPASTPEPVAQCCSVAAACSPRIGDGQAIP